MLLKWAKKEIKEWTEFIKILDKEYAKANKGRSKNK
jgi:hypothetical protein